MNISDIDFSEIIYDIEQIYSEYSNVINPIVALFISYKVLRKVASNLKVHHNLKAEYKTYKLNEIKSCPKININYSINKERLHSLLYSDSVLNFVNTILNIPNVDLTYFFNNINSFEIRKSKLDKITTGIYDISNNKIYLDKKYSDKTIIHELFHMSSSYYENRYNISYSGFSQNNIARKSIIGTGINEGYTEVLSNRYFFKRLNGYYLVHDYAQKVEKIIGEEEMTKLYFNADLYGLITNLSKYNDIKNSLRFISDIDFIHFHIDDKKINYSKKNMVLESLNRINHFLITSYLNKLKFDSDINNIDYNFFLESLATFIYELDSYVTNGRGKRFDIMNIDRANILFENASDELFNYVRTRK